MLCWSSDCAGCGAVLNPCSEVQSGSLFLNARVFHVPQGTCVPSFPEAHPAFSVVRGKIFSRRITSSSETLPRSEGRMGSSPHSDSPRHVFFNRDLKRGEEFQDKSIRAAGVKLPAQTRLFFVCSGMEEEGMVLGRAGISAGQQKKLGEKRTLCSQSLGHVLVCAGWPGACARGLSRAGGCRRCADGVKGLPRGAGEALRLSKLGGPRSTCGLCLLQCCSSLRGAFSTSSGTRRRNPQAAAPRMMFFLG